MKICDLFAMRTQTFSFEFFPPKTPQDTADLLDRARELQPLGPSFISVTYGAGGSTRHNTLDLVCRLQEELGFVAMAHLTCVGHSEAELRDILRELQYCGIQNVMCLRGDPPRGQQHFTPVADGFRHAYELVQLARSMGDFCIGVAGYPEAHPESPDKLTDLQHLKMKLDSGADFVTTQLFFENNDYFDFVRRARQLGIQQRLIPGLMPITNYQQIKRFTQMCGATIPAALQSQLDPVGDNPQAVLDIGVEWTWQQCAELLAGGAPGIHFYTMNRSLATQRIFERLRQSPIAALLPPAFSATS